VHLLQAALLNKDAASPLEIEKIIGGLGQYTHNYPLSFNLIKMAQSVLKQSQH
jgi:hypothetical protein